MGSLADRLDEQSTPEQWRGNSAWDGSTGSITTGPVAGAPLTDFSDCRVSTDARPIALSAKR